MPQEYQATDSATGIEVSITGEFPSDPDDRVRIARTANLFTRLMATILSTENEYERRERFKAIETQLELADALIRNAGDEVQELIRSTLTSMGLTDEQLKEAQDQLRSQLESIGSDPSALDTLFGDGSLEDIDFDGGDQPPEKRTSDDQPFAPLT